MHDHRHDLSTHRLLSRKEAANFLGLKESTLATWKSTKRQYLPVVKVGRLARYRMSDLLDYINNRMQDSNFPRD
jgi:predicted DNA-binding transcriptional regulator AlpA